MKNLNKITMKLNEEKAEGISRNQSKIFKPQIRKGGYDWTLLIG